MKATANSLVEFVYTFDDTISLLKFQEALEWQYQNGIISGDEWEAASEAIREVSQDLSFQEYEYYQDLAEDSVTYTRRRREA